MLRFCSIFALMSSIDHRPLSRSVRRAGIVCDGSPRDLRAHWQIACKLYFVLCGQRLEHKLVHHNCPPPPPSMSLTYHLFRPCPATSCFHHLEVLWNTPIPMACIELIACGCKSECKTAACKCEPTNLDCIPACECNAEECRNPAGQVNLDLEFCFWS